MKLRWLLSGFAILSATALSTSLLVAAAPTSPAPAKNRSLAVNPLARNEAWVCNQDNDAVVVLDRPTGSTLATIAVGVSPRNVAFNASGTKAYVTIQRGDVALDKTILEYTHTETLGSVYVINSATRAITKVLTAGIGTEPFGIALAPNGKYLLVTNMRSASLSVIDPVTDTVVATMAYDVDLSFIPPAKTVADLDANNDFIPDFESPRGVAISSTSNRAYITHLRSGYVSVIALTLNGSGVPTSLAVAKRINLNKYAFDSFTNPTAIQAAQSRGTSKFLDDITISPDGTRAWVPHVLHNVNHDVNFNFVPGAFANRVYPAVSILDLATETFQFSDPGQTDQSDRIQFDWNVPSTPTETVHYGYSAGAFRRRIGSLHATTEPILGGTLTLRVDHSVPGLPVELTYGRFEDNVPVGGGAAILVTHPQVVATALLDINGSASFNIALPSGAAHQGETYFYQAVVGGGLTYTNGVAAVMGFAGGTIPDRTFGYRAGHPSRIEFSSDGRRALLLSRGSEDIMVFDTSAAVPRFLEVFPRRDATPSPTQLDKNHTPFSLARMVGDKPTGLLITDEFAPNDEAAVLVNNEGSRDVSMLKVSYTSGAMANLSGTMSTIVPAVSDKFTTRERVGSEIFVDASRAQTTGNFNNSCESCHFEGGEDGSVWARPNGPRSTIAMYGGIRRTGALLWKGGRMNLGETGPMFGGENGGTGVFSDEEQESLTAFAEKIAVPLNPNLVAADLSADAKLGRDLFFGIDDTGLNPGLRNTNCASCHLTIFPSGRPAWFTNDQLKIFNVSLDQAHQNPCGALKESFIGEAVPNVNSGVNIVDENTNLLIIDRNGDTISDVESYSPMNADGSGDFTRDDANSEDCIDDTTLLPLVFTRGANSFDVPTKMGVFFTGPYFHDHAISSLRAVCDPLSQASPTLGKIRNTQHDLRGTNVQSFLASTNVDADIDLLLKFIRSL